MISLPTIAHVIVKGVLYHFVVVYGVSDKHITYMDPADGEMHRVAWDAFLKLWTGVLVLLEPKDDFVQGNMKTSIPQRFFQLLRPHRRVMAEVLFGAVVCSILGLSTSVYVGKIVDYVLVDENTNLLNLMGVAMLAIILIRVFISATKSILALKTSQMIDATLILGYYKHILHLPQQFFDTMRVGEIISRVNDAVKIRTFINNVLVDLVVNVLPWLHWSLRHCFSWCSFCSTGSTNAINERLWRRQPTWSRNWWNRLMPSPPLSALA